MGTRIALAAIGAVALFVLGDWYGLFGVRDEPRPDFTDFTFQAIDAGSGAPIDGVHVACVRRMQRSACTDHAGARPGQTIITLGVVRRSSRTLLFRRDRGFSISNDGPVTLMFIHPDYERHVLHLNDEDVADERAFPWVVELGRVGDRRRTGHRSARE